MKFSKILTFIGAVAAGRRHARAGDEVSRRYSQLTDMMTHYNPTFDDRKYWAYGCNCLILGDRPMSDPGHGPPIDPLDTVCKAYKDCQKCARDAYGSSCIGEFVAYNYGVENGHMTCSDTPGSCDRAICECDLKFAQDHVTQTHVFDADFHYFWSTVPGGWNPEESCPRGGGGGIRDMQCCGNDDGPFVRYNAVNHACCDGEVKKGLC